MGLRVANVGLKLGAIASPPPPGSARERRGAEHGLFLRPALNAICTTGVLF